MKKLIAIILSVGLIFGSQAAMAAGINGVVVSKKYASEINAINEGKNILTEIVNGENKTVLSAATDRCQTLRNAEYKSSGFTIVPIWTENGSGFNKEYTARVNFAVSCDPKVSVSSL